jgi:hypothetical protein
VAKYVFGSHARKAKTALIAMEAATHDHHKHHSLGTLHPSLTASGSLIEWGN